MITKLHFPSTPIGMAFGMPINEAVECVLASAESLRAASEKTPVSQGFGERLKQAVRQKKAVNSGIRNRPNVKDRATAILNRASGQKASEK